LLRKDLKNYNTIIRDENGVNNYLKQIKSETPNNKNDPLQWQSGLNDINVALNFIKPLPCQEVNTLPCKGRSYDDSDIEKIINNSKKKSSQRNRKISPLLQTDTSWNTDEEIFPKPGPSKQEKISTYLAHIPKDNDDLNKPQTSKQNIVRAYSSSASQNSSKFVQPSKMSIKTSNKNVYRSINPHSPRLESTSSSLSIDEDIEMQTNTVSFVSAKTEMYIQEMKQNKSAPRKTLGGRTMANAQFVCPFKQNTERLVQNNITQATGYSHDKIDAKEEVDERLKNIDPNMIELIKSEIMESDKTTTWDDIAGLEYTKKIIKEVVVFPMLRPDIFTGLRRPPKGILLFGPPGTGKTLIGKCIASQSKSTFFSISASSLTSKWIGDGEKMVRALFAVARVHQPSVIFIDEIDSLLTQRSETEHESSRRLKTEFLVQLDGATTSDDDRILIIGATNRPQELDEAARRRLVKRLYVALPELEARKQIINNLLASVQHDLNQQDVTRIAEKSAGYSGADMTNLCKEASMEPIRSIPFSQLENIKMEDVRHITSHDFDEALINVRPSVSQSDLNIYIEWDRTYGSGTAQNYKV